VAAKIDGESKVETRALDRGLMVLNSLAGQPDGLTAPALAEQTDLSRATVYRLLSTLEARRFVVHHEVERSYSLGPAVESWFVGRESQVALAVLAKPTMEWLAAETEETICLFVRSGFFRTTISRIDSVHVLRHVSELGEQRPLIVGATGTVLMWQFTKEQLDEAFASYADLIKTEKLDEKMLRARVEKSRKLGYCSVANDSISGIAAVGAPILRPDGRIAAALAVTGPTSRFDRTIEKAVTKALLRATREISADLSPSS
jgi:IclR family KDG regulon transcriptional repressor